MNPALAICIKLLAQRLIQPPDTVPPVFLQPDYDDEWDIEHGITAEHLEQTLTANPDAKGVFIVSPTYYGVGSDIKRLAEICHRRGVPLIVDQAWGAHFAFSPKMPPCAIRKGADLMVASIHKSMAALEQASIMFLNSNRIPVDRFEMMYDLFESTSPSVPMLVGIDATRRQFAKEGKSLIDKTLQRANHAREAVSKIEGARSMGSEVLGGSSRFALDGIKVLFDISAWGVNGWTCEDWLIENKKVSLALSDDRHLLATFTIGNDDSEVKKFIKAMRELCKWAQKDSARKPAKTQDPRIIPLPRKSQLVSDFALTPAEALFARAEHVPVEKPQVASPPK